MILSSSPLCNALLPDTSTLEETPQHNSFSEKSLDLSHSLLLVAGHPLSALGLQLELHRQRNAEDIASPQRDSFPGIGDLLTLLRATRDLDDRGHYLNSVIWGLARGLPQATVHLSGFEQVPLHDLDYAEAILHAAREGLLSAARFEANEVWLNLRQGKDWINLEVEDNGLRDPEQPNHDLTGLQTRIAHLSGKLQINHSSSRGWQLVVSLPHDDVCP